MDDASLVAANCRQRLQRLTAGPRHTTGLASALRLTGHQCRLNGCAVVSAGKCRCRRSCLLSCEVQRYTLRVKIENGEISYTAMYLCHGYMLNIIISKLCQPSSTFRWNNFISARENLPDIIMNIFQHVECCWNNFEIISAVKIIVFQFQTYK